MTFGGHTVQCYMMLLSATHSDDRHFMTDVHL